jgi:hypothetical protein
MKETDNITVNTGTARRTRNLTTGHGLKTAALKTDAASEETDRSSNSTEKGHEGFCSQGLSITAAFAKGILVRSSSLLNCTGLPSSCHNKEPVYRTTVLH